MRPWVLCGSILIQQSTSDHPHWPQRDLHADGKASSVTCEHYRSRWQEQPVHPLLGSCHRAPNPSLQKTGLACSPRCCNPAISRKLRFSLLFSHKTKRQDTEKMKKCQGNSGFFLHLHQVEWFLKIYTFLYFVFNVFKSAWIQIFFWSKLCQSFGACLPWRRYHADSYWSKFKKIKYVFFLKQKNKET